MYTYVDEVSGTLPCTYNGQGNGSTADGATVVCKPSDLAALPPTAGFYCPDYPPASCYGSNGREFLMSLAQNIQALTTDNIWIEYTGYTLLITIAFKLIHATGLWVKCQKSAEVSTSNVPAQAQGGPQTTFWS
jgi:hypothetical protein